MPDRSHLSPPKPPLGNCYREELSTAQVAEIFSSHISRGQVQYLRAGHLDVLESARTGALFSEAESGRVFIDCFTSAGCFNTGRGNPEVRQALREALQTLDLGTPFLVSEPRVALAARLAALAPGDLDRVLFVSGGGEAVDAALKLARAATGRQRVVSTHLAYHGHTGLALSANGKQHYRRYCEPLVPGFDFVPFNDPDRLRAAVNQDTAAVVLEPVQGEAGIFPADAAYLTAARDICNRSGALLILDEIQTGFARTGRFFACEHSGVVPDIMTVAKSMGGGIFPSAAVLYRNKGPLVEFAERHPDFHRTSVGGSDLGCVVSLAILDYIERNKLWENAESQGRRLRGALLELKAENQGIIREVRGVGLMVGIEYIHECMGPMMAEALARQGVFAAYSGNAPQVMRFMPSLVIGDEEMDRLVVAISAAVGHMKKILPLTLPAARVPAILRMLNSERVQSGLFGWLRRMEDAFEPFRRLGGGRR